VSRVATAASRLVVRISRAGGRSERRERGPGVSGGWGCAEDKQVERRVCSRSNAGYSCTQLAVCCLLFQLLLCGRVAELV
jgi:hypothetical protein